MKVDKVLTRFATAPESSTELRRVARALGDEMSRQRLAVLRKFRAGLAQTSVSEGSYADGYVASLLDVTAAYEDYLRRAADESEVRRLALRKDWRDALIGLRDGAHLPSDLALALGKDRPTVTRLLKKLRTAGLVQSYASDELDGRMRPHRLTVQGQRVVEGLTKPTEVVAAPHGAESAESGTLNIESGIGVAVALFRHLVTHSSSPAIELDAAVNELLHRPEVARRALNSWIEATKEAGLIGEFDGEYFLAIAQPEPVSGHNESMWDQIPGVLDQLKQRRTEQVPIYVRTTNEAWGAWAYALESQPDGQSRTIVNGDILAETIDPPARFDLVYDNPAVIGSDRSIPAMQMLLQQADEKFVVVTSSDSVPDGFIQLDMDSKKD